MPAMMAVIVHYTFKMCFQLFIFYRLDPPNVAGPGVTYPYTLTLDGPGCINNALINV